MRAVDIRAENLKPGIYFIEGDDQYWRIHAEKSFTSIIPDENRDFNLKIINAVSVSQIDDAVNMLPLFGGKTLVLVRDGGYKEKQEDKARLLSIINNPPEDVYLVFSCVNFLSAQHKKSMTAVDASKLDSKEVISIITERFKKGGIDRNAAALISEYCSRDMARIDNEINKLIAYSGDNRVTTAEVSLLVADNIENQIYEFTGAVSEKNCVKAMEIADRFETRGVSYSYLLQALINQYRRMLHSSISGLSVKELSKLLGIKEYAVHKAAEAGKKYTQVKLKDCLKSLVDAEYNFKSGKMSEETAFKTAVSALISF